jgi:hypothetical protein
MAGREREILEHAVHTIAEQAAKADDLVDEAKAAGGGNHPVTVHAKMLRSAVSASHLATGRTGSRRRTASRPFEGGACIRRGSRLAWTGSSDVV